MGSREMPTKWNYGHPNARVSGTMHSMNLSIDIPYPIPTPNQRMHWKALWVHRKHVREHVALVAKSIMNASGKPAQSRPVRLQILWHRKARPLDPDNRVAAIKPILDGLVDAGVLKDDTDQYLKGLDVQEARAKQFQTQWVDIVVTEL